MKKMLQTAPGLHPLYGFPGVVNVELPALSGTIAIAERLGYLDLHPVVSGALPSNPAKKIAFPYPYIGDLLLFLCDHVGVYCVNWTIKQSEEDFLRAGPNVSKRKRQDPELAKRAALARHEIEATYYAEEGIRTVQIAGDLIDPKVTDNLRLLHGYEASAVIVLEHVHAEMLLAFEAGMSANLMPIDTMRMLMLRHRRPMIDCQTVLYRSIWRRQLRVDLFKPILPDRPLQPETKDFLMTVNAFSATQLKSVRIRGSFPSSAINEARRNAGRRRRCGHSSALSKPSAPNARLLR